MINSAHDGGGDSTTAENSEVTLDPGIDPLDPEPEDCDPLLAQLVEWDERQASVQSSSPSSTVLTNSTKGFSMPLRLNVGLQKKKGLPHYGSLGAACHLELELEASLLERDPEEFHKQVTAAFAICRDAVAEELARRANECSTHESNGADRDFIQAAVPSVRLATGKQIRALQALAARRGFDLAAELEQRYGVSVPDELPRVLASCLIREWNAADYLDDREHRLNGSKHAT